MEKTIHDGGPAFARGGCEWTEDHGDGAFAQDGMSLRDYFAAKAMQALIPLLYQRPCTFSEVIAEAAGEYADAMLKERSKSEAR